MPRQKLVSFIDQISEEFLRKLLYNQLVIATTFIFSFYCFLYKFVNFE